MCVRLLNCSCEFSSISLQNVACAHKQEGGGLFIVGPLATAGVGSSESLWGNAVGTAKLANTNVYDNQADNVRLSTPLNSQTSEFILL